MNRFKEQNVAVTGSAAGLGRQVAVDFAKEGARMVLVDRVEPKETLDLIRKAGGKADWVLCDVTDEAQVVAMGAKAKELLGGRLDVLVNNAGFNGKATLVQDMKSADWDYTLRVNLTGTMLCCRELIPFLKATKGRIVNVSSNVGRRGLPYRSDYVCSKWALIGFTQTLALELVGAGLRVNAVCPGPIEGDRIEQVVRMHCEAEGKSYEELRRDWENVPMKRFVKAEEVSNAIRFLASAESSAMTGQALNVTGGFIMT